MVNDANNSNNNMKSNNNNNSKADIDGGYAWLVVFSSFMVHFNALGLVYSFGLYLIPISETFNTGRGAAAWTGSVLVGVMLISSMIVGKYVRVLGCFKMCCIGSLLIMIGLVSASFAEEFILFMILYGIVPGIGLSMCFTPAVSAVQTWFDKKRAFGTGVAVSGSGVGNFVFPYLKRLLLDNYEWQTVMRIEGLFVGGSILLSAMFLKIRTDDDPVNNKNDEKPIVAIEMINLNNQNIINDNNQNSNVTKDENSQIIQNSNEKHVSERTSSTIKLEVMNNNEFKNKSLRNILHSKPFILLIIANFMGSFGYGNPFFHIVAFAEDEGISESQQVQILSMFGISSLCGRILLGKAADIFGDVHTLMTSTFIMAATSCMWPLLFKTYPLLMMYAALYGFNAGAFISLPPTVCANYFGVKYISNLVGFLYSANALPAAVGPFFAGLTYDETGNYVIAGFLTGIPLFTSVIIWAMLPSRKEI